MFATEQNTAQKFHKILTNVSNLEFDVSYYLESFEKCIQTSTHVRSFGVVIHEIAFKN